MAFAKGKSGNPGGRPKTRHTQEALMMEMRSREAVDDLKGMRGVARKVWELAEEGERWAVEFIRDTLDGKPAQAVTLSGDEENPLHHKVEMDAERFTRAIAGLVARSGAERPAE